jgi:hypothetical protein
VVGDLHYSLIPGRKPLAKAVGVTGFDLDLIPAALNLKIFNLFKNLQLVNLSTLRPEGRGLPSTRAQAEGLEVHPEPCLSAPPSKAGLGASERVNISLATFELRG